MPWGDPAMHDVQIYRYQLHVQATAAFRVLDRRWRDRLKEHTRVTGATSLPPTWFTLRHPDGLLGPQGSEPRFR